MINEKKVKEGVFIIILASIIMVMVGLVFGSGLIQDSLYIIVINIAVLLGAFMILMLFVLKKASAVVLVLASVVILWVLQVFILQMGFDLISLALNVGIVLIASFIVNKLRLAR